MDCVVLNYWVDQWIVLCLITKWASKFCCAELLGGPMNCAMLNCMSTTPIPKYMHKLLTPLISCMPEVFEWLNMLLHIHNYT